MKNIIKKNAAIMSNISDMNIEESEVLLTSIVKNFDLKTDEDVIRLINALNENSNKKAVTVEELAFSLSEVLVGNVDDFTPDKVAKYAAAIGEMTRESGAAIGKALKSILSRIERMDEPSVEMLKDSGINVEDSYSGVINNLASIWNTFTKDQKREISIKLAGKYNLARFAVMMQNLSEA